MPEIIFQRLKSTPSGVAASTGKQTEVAFNDNFALVKNLLEQLFSVAAITVTSEQITQLKADTTTNPYTLYYTTDDPSSETVNWHRLVMSDFASLTGDPNDNIALKTILDSKASASDVATLQGQMTTAQTDLTRLDTTVGQHTTQIGANSAAISTLQGDVNDRVRTPHGNLLYLRYVVSTNMVEYSLDGTTWVGIASAGATFASLEGRPTDNQRLVDYISEEITNAINAIDFSIYALNTDLTSHVTSYNNPHNVTKAQLGLGNVENYSMHTMPIPDSVQAALDGITLTTPPVQNIRPGDYRSTSTDNNTVYFTSKSFPAQ